MALVDFPTVSFTDTFIARIRFCFLDRLIAPPIAPRLYQVGEEKLEISWPGFTQDPAECDHLVKYDFYLINEEGDVRDLERGKNLPDWLTFWEGGLRFEVLTEDLDDVGEYIIEIVSALPDRYFITAPTTPPSTRVEIEIVGNELTVAEQLGMNLEDQTIKMNDDLFYPIRRIIPRCPTDTYPSVTVIKRDTDDFLQWDSQTRTFIILPDVAGKEAVGSYPIQVSVLCQNSTYLQVYADQFTLTIEPVEEEFKGNYIEEDTRVIYDYRIYNSTEMEEYDEEQPVPHIVQLTNSGLLQIGWDRKMSPVEDFKAIEQTRVALRLEEYNETTQNHYWRNLA